MANLASLILLAKQDACDMWLNMRVKTIRFMFFFVDVWILFRPHCQLEEQRENLADQSHVPCPATRLPSIIVYPLHLIPSKMLVAIL